MTGTASENMAVPFRTHGNRQYLGRDQFECPDVADFIRIFSHCFEIDWVCDVMWFWPEGDAPSLKRPHFDTCQIEKAC